jgi:hypothetical protein
MFKRWIKNKELCPKVVRLGYERAKRLKFAKEPTTKTADINYDAMAVQPDKETKDLVDLVSTIFANDDRSDEARSSYDFGLTHDWSRASVKVRKGNENFGKFPSFTNVTADGKFGNFPNFPTLEANIVNCRSHLFLHICFERSDCMWNKQKHV